MTCFPKPWYESESIKSVEKVTNLKRTVHHLRQRDKDLLKSLIQSITGEDLTGQLVVNLSQGGINSVESTQIVKDSD